MNNTLRKALALLLAFSMLFAFSSVSYADDVESGSGESEKTETSTTVTVDKGDVLTTKDGNFKYYKYVVETKTAAEDESETIVYSYILEIAKYIGTDANVTVSAKLDEEVDSPYAVRVIGNEAFLMDEDTDGNKHILKNVVLPATVETIGVRAFCNNDQLLTITLPDSIKKIDNYAFFGCSSLKSIHMPESLEYIGDSAFQGCTNFIGNAYIQSEIQKEDGTYDDIPALSFSNNLTYIGDNAFTACKSIVHVTIPDGVKEICTGTFTNCSALEYVIVPDSVETIGAAFNGAYTDHNRLSSYEPKLIIKNPHCVITASPEIDKHVVVYGVKYSAVNGFADKVKCKFKEIDVKPLHEYVGKVTDPTCTEKGYTTYTCKTCEDAGIPRDDYYVTDYVDATGHSYGEWYLGEKGRQLTEEELKAPGCAYEPTCTLPAIKSRKCTVEECGYIEISRTEALGHDYKTVTTATCTQDGRTKTYCTRCSITPEYRYQVALGHDWDDGVVVSEWIECQQDGVLVKTCKREGCCDKDGNPSTQKIITPMHTDANSDTLCDKCGTYVPPETQCKCYCHATSGFKALFYKIQLFVWKLLKIYPVCDCGIRHY